MITEIQDVEIGWPEVAILPVTYLCNARCDMCALGDLKQRDRLNDDTIVETFTHSDVSSTLRSINFTGGEPTLRRDLSHLVSRLIEACPNLESFSVNSNGMLPHSAKVLTEILDVGRSKGKKLYLFISLDGIGTLHDEIRGTPGAYAATLRTIDAMRALNATEEEMSLGVSATVTRKNVHVLHDILRFAVERDLKVSFTMPMQTDVYMNNLDRIDRFQCTDPMIAAFIEFLSMLEPYAQYLSPPIEFYASLTKTLRGGQRDVGCIFQRGGFFLEPNGNILPCWRSKTLLFGSLKEKSFSEIWGGDQRREILRTLKQNFCNSCPSPCYVGFQSPLL